MTVYPDHTVVIADMGFYAQSCKSPLPFSDNNWDSVDIEKGLPRVYPGNTLPRTMTFNVTDLTGDREGFILSMSKIKGIQNFTSPWIGGSFRALIKISDAVFEDGKPESTVITVSVTEVGE
jgi:hypothetical protein